MATITITDIADLRAGDVATCSYKDHKFTGEVWAGAHGELFLGPVVVRHYNGDPSPYLTRISATREVPDLPTELGSVIANVVRKNGLRYDWAMLADDSRPRGWVATYDGGYVWIASDEIVSWDLCTVEVQA